jgi:hypothetical protein
MKGFLSKNLMAEPLQSTDKQKVGTTLTLQE